MLVRYTMTFDKRRDARPTVENLLTISVHVQFGPKKEVVHLRRHTASSFTPFYLVRNKLGRICLWPGLAIYWLVCNHD